MEDAAKKDMRNWVNVAMKQAIKDTICENKDEIIERCITIAANDMVRGAIPKLIEQLQSYAENKS